jgi:DNA-binding PucR family transcriptional regulator
VRTLELFLGSGCQWQATADALHVHVNTLRHRLQRVERLTGRDLSSMEDRVDFFIALRSR